MLDLTEHLEALERLAADQRRAISGAYRAGCRSFSRDRDGVVGHVRPGSGGGLRLTWIDAAGEPRHAMIDDTSDDGAIRLVLAHGFSRPARAEQ